MFSWRCCMFCQLFHPYIPANDYSVPFSWTMRTPSSRQSFSQPWRMSWRGEESLLMRGEETQPLVRHDKDPNMKAISFPGGCFLYHCTIFIHCSLDSSHLSTVVSEAFVRFFVELVGHYQLFFIGEREDGYSSSSSSPVPCSFQREGFRKAIPSKTVRRFLEVFMETQMFGWFIQERELHRQALRGKELQWEEVVQLVEGDPVSHGSSSLYRTVWSQGAGVSRLHPWEWTPQGQQVSQGLG